MVSLKMNTNDGWFDGGLNWCDLNQSPTRNDLTYQQKTIHKKAQYEYGSESSVIGGIALLTDMIGCYIIP